MPRKTTNRAKSAASARMRWNEDAARDLMDAVRDSGETIAGYARNHGINPWVLYDWRRRLAARAKSQPAVSRSEPRPAGSTRRAFLPVRVSETLAVATVPSAEPLEVVLLGGRRVRVPSSFDDATLRRLVSVLEEVS